MYVASVAAPGSDDDASQPAGRADTSTPAASLHPGSAATSPVHVAEDTVERPKSALPANPIPSHASPSPKRQRRQSPKVVEPLSAADAREIAAQLASPSGHSLARSGVVLQPIDSALALRYAHVRRNLRNHDLGLLGFRLVEGQDDLLSEQEAKRIIAFCEQDVEWEPRRGAKGRELLGTQRRNYGVSMDDSYRIVGDATGLPAVIDALGSRCLQYCQAQVWPYSCNQVDQVARFEQAYIQKYPPGAAQASTLGFHFDHRTAYGELICGVTICGSGKLLLAATNGGEFVEQPERTMSQDNVHTVQLSPRSLYVMTGLSRLDLRHAVVNDDDTLRISITFRSVNWDQARRGQSKRATRPHTTDAALQ